MTQKEQIAKVKELLDNDSAVTDTVAQLCLDEAADAILSRLYPHGTDECIIPARYHFKQCKLAARKYLRKGAEGEAVHNENGINRSYGSVNDEDILSEIMPFARLI